MVNTRGLTSITQREFESEHRGETAMTHVETDHRLIKTAYMH